MRGEEAGAMSSDTSMPQVVQQLVCECTARWWQSDARTVPITTSYSRRQHVANEASLGRFLDVFSRESRRPPRSDRERQAAREQLLSAFEAFGRAALDLQDRDFDLLYSQGLFEAAAEFAQKARTFDPRLTGSDIHQASRNAWAMFSLQLMLGQPVQVTPAVFAYSLLYPYSDNFLDEPAIPPQAKRTFTERLAQRLAGKDIAAQNTYEERIWKLLGMIEGQFERAQHSDLFASLQAIHRAQIRSIELLRRSASPYEVDVLGISFEKGGTSVLTGGYLVAGSLTDAQRRFLFSLGAFLQLVDDLQDVQQDRQQGLLTVFSQTSSHWRLDVPTSRALCFGASVMHALDGFEGPGLEMMEPFMKRATALLLVEAAGRAEQFYTRPYLRDLEAHFPFRFSVLLKHRRRLTRQRASLEGLAEAFLRSSRTQSAAA
jgi:hypothetical protein